MASLGWLLLSCAAFYVAGPPGALVAFALWFVVSYLPGKKKVNEQDARVFSDHEMDGTLSSSIDVDFEEMKASMEVSDVKWKKVRNYDVKRKDGEWFTRFDPESRLEEIASIKEDLAGEIVFARESMEEELQLVTANKWRPLDGHLSSRIEVAYQRYLKTL